MYIYMNIYIDVYIYIYTCIYKYICIYTCVQQKRRIYISEKISHVYPLEKITAKRIVSSTYVY